MGKRLIKRSPNMGYKGMAKIAREANQRLKETTSIKNIRSEDSMYNVTDKMLREFEYNKERSAKFGEQKWVHRIPKEANPEIISGLIGKKLPFITNLLLYADLSNDEKRNLVRALKDGILKIYETRGHLGYKIVSSSFTLEPAELHKLFIRQVETLKEKINIYTVNGTYIRDNYWQDWTQGGHYYVSEKYHFIPDGEIWIDENLEEKDREATIIHELTEYGLMKYENFDYETAHDKANEAEKKFREKDPQLSESWKEKIAGKELTAKELEDFEKSLRDNAEYLSTLDIDGLNDWIVNNHYSYYEAQIKPWRYFSQTGLNDELQRILTRIKYVYFSLKKESQDIYRNPELDESMISLLKNAEERMNVNPTQALEIAKKIQKHDNAPTLEPVHVAEAIQYSVPYEDNELTVDKLSKAEINVNDNYPSLSYSFIHTHNNNINNRNKNKSLEFRSIFENLKRVSEINFNPELKPVIENILKKEKEIFDFNTSLDNSSETLLTIAIEKMQLNYNDLESIIDIYKNPSKYENAEGLTGAMLMAFVISEHKKKTENNPKEELKQSDKNNTAMFDITTKKHEKTGKDIWIAKLTKRIEYNVFKNIEIQIKNIGGYYSKYVKGFVFDEDPAEKLKSINVDIKSEDIKSTSEKTKNKFYKKIDLPKLFTARKAPRKDIIIHEIEAGKMEYAIYKSFNGMIDSYDYNTITTESFEPAEENDRLKEELERAKGQSHWTYSASIKKSDDLGYYIDFSDYYIRYKESPLKSLTQSRSALIPDKKEEIPGGLASGKTIEDIAAMHGKDLDWMKEQWNDGTIIEAEHTSDINKAGEIALDHLFESPNYYIELEKMEKKLKEKNNSDTLYKGITKNEFIVLDITATLKSAYREKYFKQHKVFEDLENIKESLYKKGFLLKNGGITEVGRTLRIEIKEGKGLQDYYNYGYDEVFKKWDAEKEIVPTDQPEKATSRSEFLDNLHSLDLWVEFNDNRLYRNFEFKKDLSQEKFDEYFREITDRGIKERITETKDGITNVIVSVKSQSEADIISNLFMKMFPYPEMKSKEPDITAENIVLPEENEIITYDQYVKLQWEGKGHKGLSKKNIENQLENYIQEKEDFEKGFIKPSKVVGTGFKNPRKVAAEWFEKTIQELKNAIETEGRSIDSNRMNYTSKVTKWLNSGLISQDKAKELLFDGGLPVPDHIENFSKEPKPVKELHYKKGDKVITTEQYLVTPIDSEGEVISSQFDENGDEIVKILFGTNQSGQELINTIPAWALNKVKEKSLKLSDIPESLKVFMPEFQQNIIVGSVEHWEVIKRLTNIIEHMPEIYETDDIDSDYKIVQLHYFYAQSDWYIIEKDSSVEQLQAYGYVVLNGDFEMAEWGYVNIQELKNSNKVELDFYFKPVKFSELNFNKKENDKLPVESVEKSDTDKKEETREPKYKVGDYVSYEGGDVFKEKWYGVITRVIDLKKEYAYWLDAYGRTEDGLMFDGEKTNEKYEIQLKLLGNSNKFDELKKEYEASRAVEKVIGEEEIQTEPAQVPKPITEKPSDEGYELVKRIRMIIDTNGDDRESYSPDELRLLRQYTGMGGYASRSERGTIDTGLLDQFYTPYTVIEKMWGLVFKNGFSFNNEKKRILEPAVGIGRFLEYIPRDQNVVAYEIDKYAYTIAKISFPDFEIINDSFETMFFKGNRRIGLRNVDEKYDLVMGNPPYREYVSKYAVIDDASGQSEKSDTLALTFDQYMLMRSIDVLKEGGLLAFIIPSSFMANDKKYNSFKSLLAKKAKLIDAFRLPETTFPNTMITTDILVLKKI